MPCEEGPPPPERDTPFEELQDIIAKREMAAYECRSKDLKLIEWAIKVSRKAVTKE